MAKRARKESRRERYIRLFAAAVPRIERGEVVYIGLEASTITDAATCRTYWYQFKQAQRFLGDQNDWLDEVRLTFLIQDSRPVMQMVKKSIARRLGYSPFERPANTMLISGSGSSIVEMAPIHVSEEQLAAVTPKLDSNNAWGSWIAACKHDPMEHLDAFALAFDSAEGVAYRAQHGG